MMKQEKHINPATTRKVIVFAVIAASLLALFGISLRVIGNVNLRTNTEQQAILNVAVITASAVAPTEEIVLPGNVQAWHEATIFARVNGYIKKWNTDIGAHVKAGDLLAVIEAPELDAQLRQAAADLKTAEANNQLAQSTALRWQALLKTDSVSKQETDEKVSSAAANKALVVAAKANVDHLRELVSFERVIAPFDGIITSRTTDIGSLINAGSAGLRPLFHIAQANPLRVYVKVPQNYSTSIKPGLVVELIFSEHPGKIYAATLLDTASAIDPTTRTLLTQFEIDNSDYQILPGGYTEVHLRIPSKRGAVQLPVNTILFRAEGLRVGTLDANDKVILRPITIARDFGSTVEISSGVTPGERIIVNPSDSLFDGQQVKVVKTSNAALGK